MRRRQRERDLDKECRAGANTPDSPSDPLTPSLINNKPIRMMKSDTWALDIIWLGLGQMMPSSFFSSSWTHLN